MGNICNNPPEDFNDAGTELMFGNNQKNTPFQINKMDRYGRGGFSKASNKESEADEYYFSPLNTNHNYFENDPYDDFHALETPKSQKSQIIHRHPRDSAKVNTIGHDPNKPVSKARAVTSMN